MEDRSGRRVHITFRKGNTSITLAWWQDVNNNGRGFKVVELDYTGKRDFESIEKALDILVPKWSRVFTSEFSSSVISCELDKDPSLFDAITTAEEPSQFFISKETLNYCGGRSAELRLWDIEFNEKYALLIAHNKQAEAGA